MKTGPGMLVLIAVAFSGIGFAADEAGLVAHLSFDEASGKQVFADTKDPDYRKLLAEVRAAKSRLEQIKRFDMPDFRPNEHYIREMQRYGILPGTLPADSPVDPYAADEAYWKSHWYQPAER